MICIVFSLLFLTFLHLELHLTDESALKSEGDINIIQVGLQILFNANNFDAFGLFEEVICSNEMTEIGVYCTSD